MSFISRFGIIIFTIWVIRADKIGEFCHGSFDVRCEAPDEVLIIKNATYGVYGLGRCLNNTDGVHCVADVTDRLNKECLGKRTCLMKNLTGNLKPYTTCPNYVVNSLKVLYLCQKVERAACISCSHTHKARISSTSGYLASIVSADAGKSCGSQYCPWLIQGEAGQKIKISILDYSVYRGQHNKQHQSSNKNTRMFSIKDKIHSKDLVVYKEEGGPLQRTVYTSLRNQVELHVHATYPFLIHYQVLGCTDLEVKEGLWVQRMGDQIKVGCTHSDEPRWTLVCLDNEWKGAQGTCEVGPLSVADSVSQFFTTLPFSLLISAVVAMAIILSVCILTIGFMCYRRSNRSFGYKASRQGSSMGDQYVDINDPNSSLVQKIMATQKKKYATAQRENKYAMNNRAPSGTRPLPSIPDLRGTGLKEHSGDAAAPPRMMIRSYGDGAGMKRQSVQPGNKYYCIESTLGHPEMGREDLDMFPPPPELLQPPDSSQGSAASRHADHAKLFNKNNTYENQQAILGTMATAGITAAAAASSELLNKSVSINEKGACISAPLNI